MPGSEPEPIRDPYTEASLPVQSFVVQAIPAADAPPRERRGRPRRGQRARGDYTAAAEKLLEALAIFQQMGDRAAEAALWHQFAAIDRHHGDDAAAREKYHKALALFQQIGDRTGEAAARCELGAIDRDGCTEAGSAADAVPVAAAGPTIPLVLLLRELGARVPGIQRELPGWYPRFLLPALQAVLVAVRSPACPVGELEAHAAKLASVLRQRPETEPIVRVLEHVAGTPDRAMRPMAELPETIPLPDRVRNECEVLAQKIIEALAEPSGEASAKPSVAGGGSSPPEKGPAPRAQ